MSPLVRRPSRQVVNPQYVFSVVPSPLAGEGGRRPGEGWSGAWPPTPIPSPSAGRGEKSLPAGKQAVAPNTYNPRGFTGRVRLVFLLCGV
jgi:hypothetical protein